MGAIGAAIGLSSKMKHSVSNTATKDLKDASAASRASRASIYETAGGVMGEELNPDQVKRRQTILGN